MEELRSERLINALRAAREQLRQAIADRDEAWLALARIATSRSLKENDLRRLASQACPDDPWDLQIELHAKSPRVPHRNGK